MVGKKINVEKLINLCKTVEKDLGTVNNVIKYNYSNDLTEGFDKN